MTDLDLLKSLVDASEIAWADAVAAGKPGRECAALKRKTDAAYRAFEKQIVSRETCAVVTNKFLTLPCNARMLLRSRGSYANVSDNRSSHHDYGW